MRLLALVAIAAVLAPVAASAQGLGDVASRERKKRQEQGSEPHKKDAARPVFTNDDLPKEGAAPAVPAATDAAAGGSDATATAGSGGGAPPKADAAPAPVDPQERERQERERLEAEWRVRFANARERLAVAEENSWQEVVRTEFYQGVPVPMKVREKVETPQLVAARKAMADLEEEFRRTGLPPGWAR
jgi:hypothetical protein